MFPSSSLFLFRSAWFHWWPHRTYITYKYACIIPSYLLELWRSQQFARPQTFPFRNDTASGEWMNWMDGKNARTLFIFICAWASSSEFLALDALHECMGAPCHYILPKWHRIAYDDGEFGLCSHPIRLDLSMDFECIFLSTFLQHDMTTDTTKI